MVQEKPISQCGEADENSFIMPKDKVYYIVVDVYPTRSNPHYKGVAAAAIGCWVSNDIAKSKVEALTLVKEKLKIEWLISGIITQEVLNQADYEQRDDEGKAHFLQALQDGFVAHVHNLKREFIGIGKGVVPPDLPKIEDLAKMMIKSGCYSFSSEQDGQWSNGVSPEGQDFFPVWVTNKAAKIFLKSWPNYKLTSIVHRDLTDVILPRLNQAFYLIAIEIGTYWLATFHPSSLCDALENERMKPRANQ